MAFESEMQAGVCFWVPSLDVLPDAPAGYQWAVVLVPLCDSAIVGAGYAVQSVTRHSYKGLSLIHI